MNEVIQNFLARKNIIEKLEKKRKCKILVYTSQEALEYGDIPIIYQILRDIGKVDRLEVYLNSPGGDIDAAYKFVSLVRQHCKEFAVIVPFLAKSAASLIAVGADEIHMGPISELGPIDPQIKHPESGIWGPTQALRDYLSFVENRIRESKEKHLTATVLMPTVDKLDPWLLGNFERAVLVSRQYASRLLTKGMLKDKDHATIERVTNRLNEGYFSHGYVIDREEAKNELGLNVIDIPDDDWDDIWSLYLLYHNFRQYLNYSDSIIESSLSIEETLNSEGVPFESNLEEGANSENPSNEIEAKHVSKVEEVRREAMTKA